EKNPQEKRITISGGEPFLQEELPFLLQCLREKGYEDIMVYTGFTYEEICANPAYAACLPYLDVLVDGPYVEELNDDLPLRGSSNQRIIFLKPELEEEYAPCLKGSRRYQIEWVGENRINYYGIPRKGFDPKKIGDIV
ncbi:MAG: radical SAM protein, partial [Bacilli bacterium]|nr:radical SAM protein [Bacilli bacterium]